MIKILFSTYFYHSNLAQKHVFMFFCKGHKHSLVYLSSQCSLKKIILFYSRWSCITWGCLHSCSSCSRCCVVSPWPRVTGSSVAKKHARRFLDTLGYISGSLITLEVEASSDHVCWSASFYFFFFQIVRSWVICFLPRKLVDVLKRLSVSEGLVSSLWFRYFSPSSSGERENALANSEAWLDHRIMDNPFIGLFGTRKQRGLRTSKGWWLISALNPHFRIILFPLSVFFLFVFFNLCSHQMNKRKCNTATCVTQRLADFLVRSSNTIGTVYAPTNVGSTTYGKRDLPQPPSYLPL